VQALSATITSWSAKLMRDKAAFGDYYRTVLSEETDPNKLHDLQADLHAAEVYPTLILTGSSSCIWATPSGTSSTRYWMPAWRSTKKALMRMVRSNSRKAKAFVRTYGILSSVLPYSNASWEKLSIFLNFLIPKLPAPKEEDLAHGSSKPSTWIAIG
jgi:type I restriction enzyme R subunit